MKHTTEALWDEFADQMRSFIRKRISGPALIEDILQDVFLKIHANIDNLRDDTKIRSWLYRIARNTIIDHYRKPKIRTEELADIGMPDEFPDFDPHWQVVSELRKMTEALPEKYAHALLAVEFDGISQKAYAKQLDISFSGAKSRVQRGRQMLKDSLMRCCHYEFDRFGKVIDYHPITCCCCHQAPELKQ